MAFCRICGKELQDGAAFCDACGAAVQAPVAEEAPVFDAAVAEEQEFLDSTCRILRWERTAWRVIGIVFLVIGGLFAVGFGLLAIGLFAFASLSGYDEETSMIAIVFGTYALWFGVPYMAIGIVDLVAAKKITTHLNTIYADPRRALSRCNNVGRLVFTLFFNEIALIFYIINFVRMEVNGKIIARIKARF